MYYSGIMSCLGVFWEVLAEFEWVGEWLVLSGMAATSLTGIEIDVRPGLAWSILISGVIAMPV